jgi:regulatory protein
VTPEERLQHALGIALRYLNRRDRTVSELRRHLGRAGVAETEVDEAIRRLTAERYLDDARYAQLFAQDKRELERWGSERIERQLLERGVDRELVSAALADDSDQTELDRALELLRSRFPAAPENRRDRDRALGVLLRKGYDSELALDALAAHTRQADAA